MPHRDEIIDIIMTETTLILSDRLVALLGASPGDGIVIGFSDKDGKLIWKCPNCGNRDQDQMSVARRTCGYIGTQKWNYGRTQEIKERVLHVD